MDGLPEDLTDEWWGVDRAIPIDHAIDSLFDDMERKLGGAEHETIDDDPDLLPLSTGFLPLDRVLGGGMWRGTLTLVEADLEAQGAALVNTVARQVPHPCLLDGRHFLSTVTGLLAGSAGVPQVSVNDACLSESEWESVLAGLRQLRDRNLLVCSTGSIAALAHVAGSTGADVVLVPDVARFGPPAETLAKFVGLASQHQCAVLATVSPLGDLPRWVTHGVTRLGMHGFELGGRASLLRPDPEELLAVAQVEVECLSGVVR